MAKRRTPQFLSFLCVLSILYAAYNIKSSVENLFFDQSNDYSDSNFSFNMESSSAGPSIVQNFMDSLVDFWLVQQNNSVLIQSTTLLFSILSIIGVFLMYRLKKQGFLWYTISNLILIIIPFLYYYSNTVGQMYSAIQFFFTGMFIFLYASQLKHMRSDKEPIKL